MPTVQKKGKASPKKNRRRWHVYILRCSDDSLYAGITIDINKRLDRHSSGKASKYTRSRRPVNLVWFKKMKDESAARKAEMAIKSLSRQMKIALIRNGGSRTTASREQIF